MCRALLILLSISIGLSLATGKRHARTLKPLSPSSNSSQTEQADTSAGVQDVGTKDYIPLVPGVPSGANGAIYGVAFANAEDADFPISNINDDEFGQERAWMAVQDRNADANARAFVGVAFPHDVTVEGIGLSRDNFGLAADGLGTFLVQTTIDENVASKRGDAQWTDQGLVTSQVRQVTYLLARPTRCRAIRLVLLSAQDTDAVLDELLVFASDLAIGDTYATDKQPTGNGGLGTDIAPICFLYASGSLDHTHALRNIRDGQYGDDSSWCPDADENIHIYKKTRFIVFQIPDPKIRPLLVTALAIGRDNTNANIDMTGQMELFYTTSTASAENDEEVGSDEWISLGLITLQPAQTFYVLKNPVQATALKLEMRDWNFCFDEVQLFVKDKWYSTPYLYGEGSPAPPADTVLVG